MEKVFDRVEWNTFSGQWKALASVTALLHGANDFVSPWESVLTNGMASSSFLHQSCTRQGWPFSPLLFAIEPLAIWLCEDVNFKGINQLGMAYKLSLYADDLLLYISDPETSVPNILNILNQFNKISGYKLNFHKSELFPVNPLVDNLVHSLFFRLAADSFRYLGIFVTKSLAGMYVSNSEPPCWVYLEQSSARLSLHSVICFHLPSPTNISSNVVVSHSVKIWTQFRKHTGLHRSSTHSPIFKKHCFALSIIDEAFQIWSDKGIKTMDDLYESRVFTFFNSKRFDLPSFH